MRRMLPTRYSGVTLIVTGDGRLETDKSSGDITRITAEAEWRIVGDDAILANSSL
jgi:hypothetical protein